MRGIGGVDAVDVGVDVAAVGIERRRERDRRGVGAAAPERGHPVGFRVQTLEAGDDGDLASSRSRAMILDPSIASMRAAPWASSVSERDLPALPRARDQTPCS